jgi:hypothetical protein
VDCEGRDGTGKDDELPRLERNLSNEHAGLTWSRMEAMTLLTTVAPSSRASSASSAEALAPTSPEEGEGQRTERERRQVEHVLSLALFSTTRLLETIAKELTDVDLALLDGDHVAVDLDAALVNLDNVVSVTEELVVGDDCWTGRRRKEVVREERGEEVRRRSRT